VTSESVLVPTARHLTAELASREQGTRARLLRDVIESAALRLAPELTLASPHTTRLLTREALGRVGEQRLRVPDEPAARVALANAIDRAIGRLRRAGTTPAHLAAVGTAQADLLAEIVAGVDDRLEAAGLCDARAAAGIAAARIAHGAEAGELGGAVTIAGMAAWEPDDLAFFEALHARLRSRGGRGLTVELPQFAGPIARAEGDAISPVADALERRWASLTDAPQIEWRPTRDGTPRGVIVARHAEGEARAVAARVIDAIARGTPPERIAIVVPDLQETRLEPLRAVLGDAGVPFAEPRGRPVASCPEGRVALGLLAIAAGPVTRERVIELLRAPGVHPGAWMDRTGIHEAAQRAVALAHRLREVPVEIDRSGRLLIDGLTDVTQKRADESWMPRALERMLKEARWVGAESGALASRREIARRLVALVDRLKLGHPPLREIAAGLRGEAKAIPTGALTLRALGDSAAAVRALREAVRALVAGAEAAGLADAPSSPADFAAELSVAVAELGIGLSTADAGAVRIARPAELAGLEHELVIVTGLDQGSYSGAEGDLALLDERLRKRLPAVCRPPSAREREAWRRAELCWTMAGADSVWLSYSLGEEGELASPHRLVRWAAEHGAETHKEPASRVARTASRTDARSVELGALAAGAQPRGDIADRAAIERARVAFFLDPRRAPGAHDGLVIPGTDPAKQRLVAAVGGDRPERPVAVTAIERAAGCAFAGFARRVLRVRRVEDLAESADNRERGTLVHRALHAAFDGLREAGFGEERERSLAFARAAAERALNASGNLAPLRREAVRAAIADALGVVERALDEGDGVRFLSAEQSFGNDAPGAWAALPLGGDTDDSPVIYVDGQIDRIDASLDKKRARVVDYKTGRMPAADEHGRSAFQLPLYAAVVARSLGCDEVEALYVAVKPRGVIDEWPKSLEDRRGLGSRREEIAEAARRVILGMWRGEVAPRPLKATLCTRCEARDVCRRPAVAPIEESEDR
jgi:RecB family exonuclease